MAVGLSGHLAIAQSYVEVEFKTRLEVVIIPHHHAEEKIVLVKQWMLWIVIISLA